MPETIRVFPMFLLRIGTVKNSKNRLVASGPTSATSALELGTIRLL
jgi:hypothetical protein